MINQRASITSIREAFHDAEERFQRGDYESAFGRYYDLLSIRMRQGTGTESAVTGLDIVAMERLADLAVLYGFFSSAADLLLVIQTWFTRSSNLYSADFSALKLASVYTAQGLIRQAYETLQNLSGTPDSLDDLDITEPALRRWESGHRWPGAPAEVSLIFSRLYLEMARILAANGQYRNARTAADRGLRHVDISQFDISLQAGPALHLVIASAHLESGELLEAHSKLQRLDASTQTSGSPAVIVRRDELLGKLHLLRGELGLAKESLDRVIQTCRLGSFQLAELNARLNLAHLLIILNQTHRATQLIDRVKTATATARHTPLKIRLELLENLAKGRARSFIEGVSIAPSVFEMWTGAESTTLNDAEKTPEWHCPSDIPASTSFLALFEDRALVFHFHLGRSDWRAAAVTLDELRAVCEETDSRLIHTLLQALRSTLLYYQAEFDQAYAGFSQVRDKLIEMQATGLLWQVYRFLSRCQARAGFKEAAAGLRAESDDLLSRLTATLSPSDQAIYQLNKWTTEEEVLASEFDRLEAHRRGGSRAGFFQRMVHKWKWTLGLFRLMAHIDRHQSEIGERVAGARPALLPSPLAVFRWICAHGRPLATVRFVVLPDRVAVICVRAFSMSFGIAAFSRIQLRDAVRQLHEEILEGGTPHKAVETLEHLGAALQLPQILSSLPERIRHICFMPDDVLHGLPFAALRNYGEYLIERFSVSTEFSMGHARLSLPVRRGTALIAAVLEGTENYPPLEGARNEASAVSAHLSERGVHPQTLFDPSSETVLTLVPKSRFFHIICHGTFRVDAPDQSGFILVRSGQAEVLTLRQLHALDLRQVELAVLASCWSADNFLLPGRWVISLPQTLRAAGAGSILASLWETDDRLAPIFLGRFYDRLSSMARAEALRQTQLDCLHGRLANLEVSSPVFWAGFSLSGINGRVWALRKKWFEKHISAALY